jgi:hypothetical protein
VRWRGSIGSPPAPGQGSVQSEGGEAEASGDGLVDHFIAAIEARVFGHRYLATEHLLLGLIVEEHGIAGQVLLALGVRADAARAETARVLGASPPQAE